MRLCITCGSFHDAVEELGSGLQSLKYLLSGSLQKKTANFCLEHQMVFGGLVKHYSIRMSKGHSVIFYFCLISNFWINFS